MAAKGIKQYNREYEKIASLRSKLEIAITSVQIADVAVFDTLVGSKKRAAAQKVIINALRATAALGNALNKMCASFDQ